MKVSLSWKWFEVGLALAGLIAHLWAAVGPPEAVLGWYSNDDAYYYYKIARNITEGLGVTFDGLNRTNGFHPLWMAVCVAIFWLARFDLMLPLRVLMLVSAVFSLGAGILLFRLLRRYVAVEAAAFAAVLWTFLPAVNAVVVQGGLETSISAFFLMLLFYRGSQWRAEQSRKRWLRLGIIAGLATLARLDNVFVVMLFGVWFSLGRATPYLRAVLTGDLALVFVAGLLAYYLRFDNRFEYLQNAVSLPYLIGLGFLLKPASFFLFGLYRLGGARLSWTFFFRLLAASALASLLLGAALLGLQSLRVYEALPRTVIGIDWLLTVGGAIVWRVLSGKAWPSAESISLLQWDGWKAALLRALHYYLPALGMLAVYMAWGYFYVGSAMPVSGQVKRWWGGLNTIYGRPQRGLTALLGADAWQLIGGPVKSLTAAFTAWMEAEIAQRLVIFLVLAIAIFLLLLAFRSRARLAYLIDDLGLFAIFFGLYAQIFSYTTTLYMHRRPWYWSGELLFTLIGVGLLVGLSFESIRSRSALWLGRLALAGLSLVCVLSLVGVFQNLRTSPDIYRESRRVFSEVEFLQAKTPPGALIGITGGGTAAYFLPERSVVNLDGLVNSPEYFALMQENRGAELLDKIGLDYVFGRDYKLLNSAPYQNMFKDRLQLIEELSDFRFLYRYLSSGN